VPYRLDLKKMESASKFLVGTHDFSGFMAAGSDVKTTVRTIYNVEFTKKNEIIKLQISGSGFLYNMVRIIVGTLVDVGKGTKNEVCFEDALRTLDRTVLGHTARPEGLFLKEVKYN
jgi:tRNA pseudouridine38-40 synthase